MPKKRLAKLYERSIKNEFSFIKSRLSKLKAEKVVSPPQNPTIKKRDKSDFKKSGFDSIWKKNPINKQPAKFTKKVETGNSPLLYGRNFPMIYLRDDPIPPPKKTIRNCFNFVLKI